MHGPLNVKYDIIPTFVRRCWAKATYKSLRTAAAAKEIRTGYLPNKSIECYRCTNLLGVFVWDVYAQKEDIYSHCLINDAIGWRLRTLLRETLEIIRRNLVVAYFKAIPSLVWDGVVISRRQYTARAVRSMTA